jgi:hypothetical protein
MFSYFDVIDACAKPGCPFCRLSDKTVNSYLDGILYENVNDPGTRAQLQQSLGYCNKHAWRLPQNNGAALGVAIIYRDLLSRLMDDLKTARYRSAARLFRRAEEALDRSKSSSATEATVRALAPQAECPACAQRDLIEDIALLAMLDALARQDEGMQSALEASSGLCLVHLRRSLELCRDQSSFQFLTNFGQAKIAALLGELSEYVRKSDYRFSPEGFGAEGDSWLRAIAVVVGQPGVR